MNKEDIQEEFRQQTQEPTRTLNKSEVGVNPKYVIWLEKRILALSTPSLSKSVVCDYCKDTCWDSHPNHDTTLKPCPECQE